MQFPFTTTTDTHRIIEAKQFGNWVRILVLGATWSDVSLEWVAPLVAEARVNKLIAQHSKKPKHIQYDVTEKRYVDWDTHGKWYGEWTIKGWGSFNLDLTQSVTLHWDVKYPDCNGEDCVYANVGSALVFIPIRIVTVEIDIKPRNRSTLAL